MADSTISGDAIPPGDERRIKAQFDSGQTRVLVVNSKEEEQLLASGRDVTPLPYFLFPKLLRAGAWILGLAVTVLVLPALTKQWADRPKELEAKNLMATALTSTAATAMQTGRLIVARDLPDAVVARRACSDAEESASPRDQALCRRKLEAEIDATVTQYNESYADWLTTALTLEASAQAFFPDNSLSDKIEQYAEAVRRYLHLASFFCDERDPNTFAVLNYLDRTLPGFESDSSEWQPLLSLDPAECRDKSRKEGFLGAYRVLGNRLLEARHDPVRGVITENMEGFSSGFADFASDSHGSVIVLVAGGMLVLLLVWQVVAYRK